MQLAGPAEQYDRFMGRYAPSLASALADASEVAPGQRVCDVGCGPGGLTGELAGRVGATNIAAIDPAPQFTAATSAATSRPAVSAIRASTSASVSPNNCPGQEASSTPRCPPSCSAS